jgi:titin
MAQAVSTSSIALSWEDHSADETSFIVERSIHLSRDFTPVKVTGADETTYTDDGLSDGIYYYRVKAVLPDARSTQPTAVVAVALNVNPLILSATEVTECNKTFLDPGGLEDYQDHQDITMVIHPAETGKKVQVSFSSFALASTEFESDQLEVFDGDDIRSARLVGTYTRKSLPADVNATTASGALIFHFVSRSTTGFGWQAQLSCVTMPETPANLIATASSDTQINIDWEDLATTETGYRVERGIPPFAAFREIAVLPANTTHYEQTGLRTDNVFTYRVQALDGTVYSGHSNAATAVIGRDPLLMRPGTFSTCGAVFLDPAGGEGYYDTTFVNMTLRPSIPGTKVAITFSEFDLGENQFDRLAVINSRVVNWYGKTEIPPRIVSYDDDGSLRLEFSSGFGGAHGKGWRAEIACLTPPAPPTNLIATASGDNQVHLTWIDHADDETDYTVERAVNDGFFVTVASLDANAQTYDDTGLITGVPYTYRVWAEINDDLFSRSNESTVTLVVVDPPLAVESDPDHSFIVRPNPASETIHITSEVYNIRRLSLIDVLGRTCLEVTPLRADYVLEIRTLSPGIYTLLIQTENSISAARRIQIIR